MALVIDAHQHFWRDGTYQTSWMAQAPYAGDPKFEPLRRHFGPAELRAELDAAGVAACVTVEAADHRDENAALLANARRNPWIAGVVGWVPLTEPELLSITLDTLRDEPRFVGVRHLINVEPDPDWILRPDVLDGLREIAAGGLAFDYVGIPSSTSPTFRAWLLPFRGCASSSSPRKTADRRRRGLQQVGKRIGGGSAGAGHLRQDFRPRCRRRRPLGGRRSPSANRTRAGALRAAAVDARQRLAGGRAGYAKVWAAMNAALDALPQASRDAIRGGTAATAYRLDLAAFDV